MWFARSATHAWQQVKGLHELEKSLLTVKVGSGRAYYNAPVRSALIQSSVVLHLQQVLALQECDSSLQPDMFVFFSSLRYLVWGRKIPSVADLDLQQPWYLSLHCTHKILEVYLLQKTFQKGDWMFRYNQPHIPKRIS